MTAIPDAPPRDALAGASVLVVDDEPVIRWTVVQLLARAGARVREAANGEQAIAIAAAEHVDLLLTDVDMPGRDGPAVALAVATIRPAVVIVYMSGRSREHHLAGGRIARHACLVEKPFGGQALVTTLETALASARAAR